MYVGQDAYQQAQQYGTFGLNINVRGPLDPLSTLPAPIFDIIPGSEDVLAVKAPPIPNVAPLSQPFPWGIVVILAALFLLSRR